MISIIIPTYNREHLIIETLTSIKNQTYTNWECILIDDGSTDATFETIENFRKTDDRFKVYNRPSTVKKGPSACRNYAFTLTKGTFVQFFDSDDIMHPNHLQKKIATIENADLVICKLKMFFDEFQSSLFDFTDADNLVITSTIFDDFVTGKIEMMMVAPMWRKTTLAKFLPINENMHILEDHDLHARALINNLKVTVVNKYLIFYRKGHEASTSHFFQNISTGIDSYLQAKQTVLNLKNTNEIKLSILKQVLGYFRLGLAARKFSEAKKCLNFIRSNKLAYSLVLKLKLFRINMLYYLIKWLKKGDFFFKTLFKSIINENPFCFHTQPPLFSMGQSTTRFRS